MPKITKVKFINSDGKWVTENCHDISTCREHSYKLDMTNAILSKSKSLVPDLASDDETVVSSSDVMKIFDSENSDENKVVFEDWEINNINILAMNWYSSVNAGKWDDHLNMEVFPENRVPQSVRKATRDAMYSAQAKLTHGNILDEDEVAALKTGAEYFYQGLTNYSDAEYSDFKDTMKKLYFKINEL